MSITKAEKSKILGKHLKAGWAEIKKKQGTKKSKKSKKK